MSFTPTISGQELAWMSKRWIQFCPTTSPYFNNFQHLWTVFNICNRRTWFAENSFYDLACRRRCRAQDCIRQFAAGGTMTTVDHDYRMAGPSGPSGTRSSHANSLHELNTSATSWRQLAVHCGCKNIWPVNHQHVDLISTGAIYHSLEVKQDSSWWERFMCQSSLSIAVPPGVLVRSFNVWWMCRKTAELVRLTHSELPIRQRDVYTEFLEVRPFQSTSPTGLYFWHLVNPLAFRSNGFSSPFYQRI